MNKSKPYKPWLVIVTASLFFCFIFAQISMFNAISAPLIKSLNLSMTEYGQLSAYYFYGNMIFLVPAGIMLDRVSNTKILIAVTAISAIATYGFSVAHSVATAEFMRLITGIVGAFAFITVLRLATKWFSPEKLAGVLGVVVTLAMIGGMIAQTPFVWLTETYGWRNTLLYNSIAGAIITVLIALIVKDSPKQLSQKSKSNVKDVFLSLKKALRNKQNWLAGISISLLNLPIFVFGATWGSIYLKQIHHMTSYQSSFIISMVFVGMIIGSPISGWFSDRYTIIVKSFIPKLTKKKQ
jgi:sugar phosphate permease